MVLASKSGVEHVARSIDDASIRPAVEHPRFELTLLARASKEATKAKSAIPRPSPLPLHPLPQPAFQKVHRLVVPVP